MSGSLSKNHQPVWGFTDYRAFLSHSIAVAKSNGSPISNRWFAKAFNMNSSSYITLLLQGKRNLNRANASKIARLLHLSRSEGAYFETLVEFNQARKLEDRNRLYQTLMTLHKRADTKSLSPDQFDFYSTWYHSAMRALVHLIASSKDCGVLGEKLIPPITEAQARKSVDLLEKLGLIRKKSNGTWEVTSPSITTGEQVRSLHISNFQRETLKLAWEALDRVPKEQRDFSTLTVGISAQGFQKIRELVKEFRSQVDDAVRRDTVEDRVYQLNLQLFPLSQPIEKRKRANV